MTMVKDLNEIDADHLDKSNVKPSPSAHRTVGILSIGDNDEKNEFPGGTPEVQYQVEKEKYNRLIKAIIAQYEPQNEDEQQTLEHLFETIFIQQHLHLNPTNTSDFRKMLHEELSDWTEKLESVDFEVLKMGTTHAIQEIINNLKGSDTQIDPENIFGVILADAE